jgi:hypothetical protein
MEKNKNINHGDINSGGGSVHVGDLINDLSIAYNQVYKELITNFEKQLHSFKPKTARQLLDQLEIDIAQKEKIENIVKSKIEFLKATCDGFLDVKADVLSVALINAYNLNKSDFKLKEIATLEYLKLNEPVKANELVDEILAVEEYNPVAWAVKALLSSSTSLECAISQVPELVRKNLAFRRIIYFHSKKQNTYEDLETTLTKFQILMSLDDYDKTPLSFQNYKDRLFLIESLLSIYSQKIWISFNKQKIEDPTELTKVHEVLTSFINEVSGTEIQSSFPTIQFYAAYFEYQLNSDIHAVHEMVKCYEKMSIKQLLPLMLTANSLQQINECDKAIEIIEQQEEKDPISIDLMMFCHIKRDDGPAYLNCAKEYLSKVKKVSSQNLNNYFFIPQTLNDFGCLSEIEASEFTNDKSFDSEDINGFLSLFIYLLKGNRRDRIADDLLSFYNNLSYTEEALLPFFATCFYKLENHEKCCEVYERFVRTEVENADLHCYILSLYRSKNRHKDLIPQLSNWRNNFSFQEQLVRLEIELRRQLFQWDEVIVCCEYMFEQQIINEFNLINYAIAIHECDTIQNKDDKIRLLLSNMEKTTLKNYSSYSTIITVLERSNFSDEALELLFDKAKEKSSAKARQEFFNFTSFRKQKYLESYDEIKEGVFIKFKINETEVLEEVTKEMPYFEQLIGRKVDDEIAIPSKFSRHETKITILRIMNKYLALYDEILKEVHINPLSQLPMESFDVSKYIDGSNGKSILDFFEELGGNRTVEELEQNFNAYYNHEITFTHMVSLEYSDNYLKAYYSLVKERQGLTQVNPLEFGIGSFQKYDEFILDFTSLLRFFELSRSTGTIFDVKFTIASSTVSLIKTYSTEFPPISVKEFVLDQDYYNNLLAWIKDNCQTKMPVSKLDAVAMAVENRKRTIVEEHSLDHCCLLLDNEKALFITDDFFYFKLFPVNTGKIISPWLFEYLKSLESS